MSHRFESRFEGTPPRRVPASLAAAPCSTSGHTSSTRRSPCSARWRPCHAESRTRESRLDDDVFVALRHTSGAVSHLWGSWSQHAPGPRFRVTGSAASLVVTTADTQEDVLVTGVRPSPGVPWGVEKESDLERLFTPSGMRPVSLVPGAWYTYYPAFARAVRGEGPPPVEAADAVATADVLEVARLSVERRTTVRPGADR